VNGAARGDGGGGDCQPVLLHGFTGQRDIPRAGGDIAGIRHQTAAAGVEAAALSVQLHRHFIAVCGGSRVLGGAEAWAEQKIVARGKFGLAVGRADGAAILHLFAHQQHIATTNGDRGGLVGCDHRAWLHNDGAAGICETWRIIAGLRAVDAAGEELAAVDRG